MAYSGYLIEVNNTRISYNYIQYGTYHCTPNQRLDLDSFRDSTGILHRNVLNHTATKITFQTVEMNETTKVTLMNTLNGAFINSLERKLNIKYYSPDLSIYKNATVYMPDIDFELDRDENGVLWYKPFTLTFIEY